MAIIIITSNINNNYVISIGSHDNDNKADDHDTVKGKINYIQLNYYNINNTYT